MNSLLFHNKSTMNSDKWKIYVNGYKNEIDLYHRIDSDWLEGGIKLYLGNEEYSIPLSLLLVEELHDFLNWLIKKQSGIETNPIFQFMDTVLCFETVTSDNEFYLKLNLNRINKKQISIISEISGPQSEMHSIIEELNSLITKYPCRCNNQHIILT